MDSNRLKMLGKVTSVESQIWHVQADQAFEQHKSSKNEFLNN
jgi:hypothetical protein